MRLPPCLFTLLLAAGSVAFALEPISPQGERLNQFLDSMHVTEHWIAGVIVNWKTGDPTGKPVTDTGKHTHCSQFAASACDRLGIYLLRPPEHSAVLLANAQFDWLPTGGAEKGWAPVADGQAAQDLANRGHLVVAVYRNANPKKSGHIAIIRPGQKTEAEIAADGPDIIQAGGHNYNRGTLRQGFANHPTAFAEQQIRFFSHPTNFPEGQN